MSEEPGAILALLLWGHSPTASPFHSRACFNRLHSDHVALPYGTCAVQPGASIRGVAVPFDPSFAHYHKRSNVEAAFSAIKRKFGDSVRAKGDVAQRNEVLLKIQAHNLVVLVHEIHELGITPVFQRLIGCTETLTVAQEAPTA